MVTRIIHTKIYTDTFFMELAPLDKLLFLYYITNEQVNIIHCYECPDRKVSYDTGIDTPRIRVFQEKMEKAGKMFFKDGYVFLKNANKYESYKGELNEKAKEKLISQLSIPIREWYEGGVKGVYIPLYIPTINHNTEIINHNKGVVKGEKILDDPGLQERLIAQFPEKDVPLEIEKMKDWLASSGKSKKDYVAFARNWLRNNRFGEPEFEAMREVNIS